jgi:hypothetical protein
MESAKAATPETPLHKTAAHADDMTLIDTEKPQVSA